MALILIFGTPDDCQSRLTFAKATAFVARSRMDPSSVPAPAPAATTSTAIAAAEHWPELDDPPTAITVSFIAFADNFGMNGIPRGPPAVTPRMGALRVARCNTTTDGGRTTFD